MSRPPVTPALLAQVRAAATEPHPLDRPLPPYTVEIDGVLYPDGRPLPAYDDPTEIFGHLTGQTAPTECGCCLRRVPVEPRRTATGDVVWLCSQTAACIAARVDLEQRRQPR